MPVIEINSGSDFKELLKSSKKYVIVDFSAKWCGPCKKIAPKFKDLSEKYHHITFVKVDVDEVESLTTKYNITCMPTFLVFAPGRTKPEYNPIEGADLSKIENMLRMLTGKDSVKDDF